MREFMDDVTNPVTNDSEIHQAEYHLRKAREPHPALVAIAVGLLLAIAASKTANATESGCGVKLKTVQFSGKFTLENQKKLKAKPLRFVIGMPEGATDGGSIAQIWSGENCQASCSSVVYDHGDTSLPISLDLQCRGEVLGPLSAHVAVLWDHGPKPSTQLRFGTWVEGYEQAQLQVEVDHFNTQGVAQNDTKAPETERYRKRKLYAYRAPGLSVASSR